MNQTLAVKADHALPFHFHRDGDAFVPSIHTRNPWMGDAIAGGPVSALIGEVIQAAGFAPGLEISRTTLDIFGKVPSTPLIPRVTALREGRQMQLHRIELLSEGRTVAQSHVILARHLETPQALPPCNYQRPEAVKERAFFIGEDMEGAIRTRPIEGGVHIPGRGVTWITLDGEIIKGTAPTPFVLACLFSDYGNGIGSATHSQEWTFANLDITVNYLRMPRGKWLLVDSATFMAGNGHGLARSTFADIDGIFAFGCQTTFVGPGA
jgi:hypothetical protein